MSSPTGGRVIDPLERMHRRLRLHRDRLATILESLRHGSADVEELHEWHRELKRLRLDARLWVRLAPRGRTSGYPETDAALKRLARSVGSVRNHDVGLELLSRLGQRRHTTILPTDLKVVTRRLVEAAHTGRTALAASVGGSPGEELLRAFERPLGAVLPRAAIPRLHSALDDELTVRLARLERALGRAYRRPSIARLHRLRIALRSARIVEQTRRAVLGTPPLPVSPALRKMQVELGQLNDLEVLRRTAASSVAGAARKRVDRVLRRERRDRRRELERRLGRKEVRRDWERLLDGGPG